MRSFRFRKLFENDGRESSLTQYDLKKYARLAVIEDVDPEKGVCNVRWLDRPGKRKDVIITQNSSTNYSLPEKGSVVVCVFDKYDRAFITSYIPLGQVSRVQDLKTLPKFKEGETFFEAGGSYVYIRKNGNIILSTPQGYMLLDNSTDTLSQEFANWKLTTEGVHQSSGLVKRYISTLGNKNIEVIEKSDNDVFVEHKLKVHETNSEDSDLLYDLTIGTIIDDNGNPLSRTDNILSKTSSKQICVDLKLNNGIRLTIDKDGYVQIDGAKAFINNPSVDADKVDSDKNLSNNSSLGEKGQHVAREHDEITVPVSNNFNDSDHVGLTDISTSNIRTLTTLAAAIISPAGPCTLNPSLLNDPSLSLKGLITKGAENILIGDE
ncbi:MAG: hypothetical protein M0Q88_07040 [Bacilli bacterium]|nr:hypothetical protein [Bacilli bacterium]